MSIGLGLPCLNEEDGLRLMLAELPPCIDKVVVADNGSTDQSREVARSFGAEVVDVPFRGYGHAMRAALLNLKTDVGVTMDADHTYPLEAIEALVTQMHQENLDFITVSRQGMNPLRSLDAFVRRMGERVLAGALSFSTGVGLSDSQSGMWIIRMDRLPEFLPDVPGMSFSQEIKIRALLHPKIKAREISVPFPNHARPGKSKLRLWEDGFDNLRLALDLGRKLKKEHGHAGK